MRGQGKKEKKKEKRRKKEKVKKKKREKGKRGKRRKRKEGAGGILGVGREPGVASTRSDAQEKRGEQGMFKRRIAEPDSSSAMKGF